MVTPHFILEGRGNPDLSCVVGEPHVPVGPNRGAGTVQHRSQPLYWHCHQRENSLTYKGIPVSSSLIPFSSKNN